MTPKLVYRERSFSSLLRNCISHMVTNYAPTMSSIITGWYMTPLVQMLIFCVWNLGPCNSYGGKILCIIGCSVVFQPLSQYCFTPNDANNNNNNNNTNNNNKKKKKPHPGSLDASLLEDFRWRCKILCSSWTMPSWRLPYSNLDHNGLNFWTYKTTPIKCPYKSCFSQDVCSQ